MRAMVVVVVVVMVAPVVAQTAEPPARQSYSERYGILTERNIFVRDRVRPAPTVRAPSAAVVRAPEEFLVVRGIVVEDGEYRVYVENTSTGGMLRVAEGDAIARGTIATVEIDAVEYVQGEVGTWIEVGRDFTGQVPTRSTAVVAPVATTTGENGGAAEGAGDEVAPAAIDPDDPNLTIEQRLRLRRLQELSQ